MTGTPGVPAGERDLDRLRATMNPVLDPARSAFCQRPDERLPPGATALGMFREAGGVTSSPSVHIVLGNPLAAAASA